MRFCVFDTLEWKFMKMNSLVIIAAWLVLFSFKMKIAHSLECVYCPSHTTEDECREMNLTQICIHETKCGYARFIEKRKDLGELYPEDFKKEVYHVTVKKGCMDENYCTKMQTNSDDKSNSTECIFCDQDLCVLELPILCVECDEAQDIYCGIQTGPIKRCSQGEVCFRQRLQVGNYTQKRGCIESSRCLKQDYCEYCNTDICWTDPIPPPSSQKFNPTNHSQNAGNVTTELKARKVSLRGASSTKIMPHLILTILFLFFIFI